MAKKNDYGLPDEDLQLIAGAPDIFAGGKFLQGQGSRVSPSELINAIRAYGTDNRGFTQYANAAGPNSASARTIRRGLNNPARLGMSRVTRDVTLPGAETPTRVPRVVDPTFGPVLVDDNTVVTTPTRPTITSVDVGTPIVDTPLVPVGTVITDDDIVDDDIVDDGTGGTGGSGTAGTGGTSTGGMGGTGTTGTGVTTAGTGTVGGTSDLRSAIAAAMGGSGSIDNSAAGVESAAGSLNSATSLTGDQIASLTRPKVASVTLESSGPALDQDTGATSMTFDYPELLSPEELQAYEAWMKSQAGGAAGAGKANLDETLGTLEF